MPKRNADSESDSAEEDLSEYSNDDASEEDASEEDDELAAHEPLKPQRPVKVETESGGDRGLSESEDGLVGKAESSGEHPEDAGREDVDLEFGVVQNQAPLEDGQGPSGGVILRESPEVLGEIVECEEGEATVRVRLPPNKKKVLTKREYPSDSDVSLPDSKKAAVVPRVVSKRDLKIETIDPDDDEESEEEEEDDPNDEEFQPDSPKQSEEKEGSEEEDEDSFVESESEADRKRRSKRATSNRRASKPKARKESYEESSESYEEQGKVRRSTRAGSARRGTYKEEESEEDWEDSEEEYVKKPKKSKAPKKSKGAAKSRRPKKNWEEDDFIVDEDEEESEDDSEASEEESDEDFTMGRRSASKRKPAKAQKRNRVACSEPSSSEEDESDEEYGSRRSSAKRKKPTKASKKASTVRATRSRVGKVEPKSYYEGGDSDDEEYAAAPKTTVELEEEGEAIESVWSHQAIGTEKRQLAANESTAPKVDAGARARAVYWEREEFYVKWKGRSYIHNTWETLATLEGLPGLKRVVNYMKRVEQEHQRRAEVSPEEAELMDVQKEMDLEMIEQYTQVDRIIAEGVTTGVDGEEVQQYFVKWQGLAYEEATWENVNDIAFAQDKIDEFKTREANSSIRGKTVDEARRIVEGNKGGFLSLQEQPEWLKGGGKLRDYQLEGLNRLIYSWGRDINIILADEMGLGKTLQSVSMLGYLQNEQQIQGPFLVVVPLSVVTNWVKEFRKWLPDMNIVVYVGNRASRDLIMTHEFWTGKKSGRLVKFNTLITTYEIVMKDKTKLSQIKWSYLMVDEAHRLKNHEAALYTSLMEFSSKNKLLITGTPLQNNIEELWALLHFLTKEKFPSDKREDFIDKYRALQDVKDVAQLHEELRPHLLRRVIKDVEKSLPPKYERILRVGMSPLQKQYYKWILERNFQDLNRGAKGGGQLSLLNMVVELKKCCNHPFLFESAEHGYAGGSGDRTRVQRLVLSSGKLVLLDKLLTRLKETGHRVLIFSQMVRMLDILSEYLSLKGYKSQRLDGSTRADLRHQAMEHFNAPGSEDFCFLLSTRAGGLGVNLATADTVIIFDSDWNPQNDLQAMSRAHRIGQQDVVNIYRFVTSGSVEEDILERARQKMILDHLVIQKMNASGQLYVDNKGRQGNKGGKMFKEDDLKAILRFGAEDLFKDKESGEESERKLENMDIDEILARAEKVDAVAAAGAAEGNDDLMGTFKVANFTSNEDDATFWSRLIQPAERGQEAELGQRAARDRPVKTYMEEQMEDSDKKHKSKDRSKKDKVRSRKAYREESVPEAAPIDGAHARVSEWGGGKGLSKKDTSAFVKAVKKFGDESRMDMIAEEAGGAIDNADLEDQVDLFRALYHGCKNAVASEEDSEERAKGGPLLDFFGVPVKAAEVLSRIKELALLAKSVRRFNDPPSQYRLKSHPKNPQWHKTCGWTQVDDAHLLLGVHYHGFGNWEKMRTDERLNLDHKIAAAGLSANETTLPRAVHLDARAAKLLKEEREHIEGPAKAMKGPLVLRKSLGGPSRLKEGVRKREREEIEEGEVGKEEGEISGGEEKRKPKKRKRLNDKKRKDRGEREAVKRGGGKQKDVEKTRKDEKWRLWCEEEMSEMQETLDKLQGLQDRKDLSKDKTVAKVKKYLKLVGEHIDMVIGDHTNQDPDRLANRLWTYTATFSSMDGKKLADVYQKLKAQKRSPDEGLPPPSHRRGVHQAEKPAPRSRDFRPPESGEHSSLGRPSSREKARVHSPNILRVERPPSRDTYSAEGARQNHFPLARGAHTGADYYPSYAEPVPPAPYLAERAPYPGRVRGDVGYDVYAEAPIRRPHVSPRHVPSTARGPLIEAELPRVAEEAYGWRDRGIPHEPVYGGRGIPQERVYGDEKGHGWRSGEIERGPRWAAPRMWPEEPVSTHRGWESHSRYASEKEPGEYDSEWGARERALPRDVPLPEAPPWSGAARPGRAYVEEPPPRRWEVDKKVIVEERTDGHMPR